MNVSSRPSASHDELLSKYNCIVKEGYLQKKSKTVKKARKRWMVLKGNWLSSYKSNNSKQKQTETFNLAIYNKIKVIDTKQFELVSDKNGSRIFIADSSENFMDWINVIRNIQKKLLEDTACSVWICCECNRKNERMSNVDRCRYCKKARIQKLDSMDELLSSDNEGIIEQLKKFGYSEKEILSAIQSANNKQDINEIVECIKAVQIVNDKKVLENMNLRRFEDPNAWNILIETMDSMDIKQQLRVIQKLKKIANKMMKQDYDKYDRLYLDKGKLKYSVLVFNGGLQFLYTLGFEQHKTANNKLVCNKINKSIVKACIQCLNDKIKILTQEINMRKSPSLISIGKGHKNNNISMSWIDFDPFTTPTGNDKEEELKECDQYEPGQIDDNQVLWEQYIAIHGKPTRAEQFMKWAKANGKMIKFIDAKNLIKNNGHIVVDMHIKDKKQVNNVKNGKYGKNEKERKSMKGMDGETKQFYNFLKEHRLEKYFGKFKDENCCYIGDIEYLDDEEYLRNDIGIKSKIERKRLIGECKKLKERMDEFKRIKISEILRQKLNKYGVVTMDILCKEIQNKLDLRGKYGLNDEQCDLLWNIIDNDDDLLMMEGTEQEGVVNVAVDVNVVDTMHGYIICNVQQQQKNMYIKHEMDTPYM